MAQTIPNVEVRYTEWTNLNTELGIAVGTAFTLQNVGAENCYLYEGSEPAVDVTDGSVLTRLGVEGSIHNIPAGSLTIWAKAMRKTTKIHGRS